MVCSWVKALSAMMALALLRILIVTIHPGINNSILYTGDRLTFQRYQMGSISPNNF